jgi:hypothetical protein
MIDEDLIGHLLGALEPTEHLTIQNRLSETPELAARLEHLRLALQPLEAIRDPGAPPAGLADRTLARLAGIFAQCDAQGSAASPRERLAATVSRTLESDASDSRSSETASPVTTPRAPREAPETRTIGGRLRADLIVACAIAFLGCGLVLSAVSKVRAQSQLLECQSNLRKLYIGLVGYADTHEGYYPQVATNATADSFVVALQEAGQVPADFRAACPVGVIDEAVSPVSYTYSLGFQDQAGRLVGLRRPADGVGEHDLLPISADYPTAEATPVVGQLCPHPPVMNVLYLGGQVRTTTSPLIGPNGDDIYRNINGQVAAGLDRSDVVLGRASDRP